MAGCLVGCWVARLLCCWVAGLLGCWVAWERVYAHPSYVSARFRNTPGGQVVNEYATAR